MSILKDEINACIDSIYSLSQWRLAIVALLSAAGLGLWTETKDFAQGYFLLFLVPFVCAYVDMLIYERSSIIHTIARFLRKYEGPSEELKMLSRYEKYVNERRLKKGFAKEGAGVNFERKGNFAASLVASVLPPALALANEGYRAELLTATWIWVVPIVGVGLVIFCARQHKVVLDKLTNDKSPLAGDKWCSLPRDVVNGPAK